MPPGTSAEKTKEILDQFQSAPVGFSGDDEEEDVDVDEDEDEDNDDDGDIDEE